MRTRSLTAAAVLLTALYSAAGGFPQTAGTEQYEVDTLHSSALFRVKHLGVAYFYGRFNDISGTFTFHPDDLSGISFDITVKADSVDTNNPGRDKHLKSPDFFSAAEFPTITFKSKAVRSTGPDQFEVSGDLQLHGVTKPLTVKLEHTGTGPGLRGGVIRGFEGSFTVKRSEFGMNYMLDKLGDEVRIIISLEGHRP